MFGMTADALLQFVTAVYFVSLIVAAVAGAASIIAGYAQNRINNMIEAQKDRALQTYQADAYIKIAEANAQAKQAEEKAADADEKVAQANIEIARLNLADTQLQAQNLKLEAQVAPRRITKVDPSLDAALGKFAPKTIKITSYSLDPDGAILATQMLEGLKGQKFIIQDARMTQGPSSSLNFGVWISGPNKHLVDALVALFRNAGLFVVKQEPPMGLGVTFNGSMYPGPQPDASILVGLKPLPGMVGPP